MPVKVCQTSVIFWFFLSYLVTTVTEDIPITVLWLAPENEAWQIPYQYCS